MRAGFVGLGAMGQHMARNLHKHDLLAAVWNRTPAKAQALATETGCFPAPRLDELASRCDAIVVCVSADSDLLEIVGHLADLLPPRALVVDCSTVSAGTARQ